MKSHAASIFAVAVASVAAVICWPAGHGVEAQSPPDAESPPEWHLLGPVGSQSLPGNGRVNAVAFHPNNDRVILIGTAGGGVWRSDDEGQTWRPIGDRLPNLAVSSIAVDPRAPDTLYVATGDGDWRRQSDFYSSGIVKSTDGLKTWEYSHPLGRSEKKHVRTIVIHPSDSMVLLAAASDAVYKTVNGGVMSGGVTSWMAKLQLPAAYAGQGFVDLDVSPDGSRWYAALWGRGVYVSDDAGERWTLELPAPPGAGRIAVAVGPTSDPLTAYAIVVSDDGGYGQRLLGMYRTTNGGQDWTSRSATYSTMAANTKTACGDWTNKTVTEPLRDCLVGSQADFNLALTVSPSDPDTLYLGTQELFESTDGGDSWHLIVGYWRDHPDYHAIEFPPGSDGSRFLAANDGGMWSYSHDPARGLWTGVSLNRGLAVSLVWRAASSPESRSRTYAGLHDNGIVQIDGPAHASLRGGDGGDCVVALDALGQDKPTCILLGSGSLGIGVGGCPSGDPKLVDAKGVPMPLALAPPGSPYAGQLYAGTNWGVYRRESETPRKWVAANGNMRQCESVLHFIVSAPSAPTVMYAYGQEFDSNPRIWRSVNGGVTWSVLASAIPGYGQAWIFSLAVDPADPDVFWVGTWSSDSSTRVWRYDGTWHGMSGPGLPSVPVRAVAIHPVDRQVYVGTDVGVYRHVGSGTWQRYGSGLPNVAVRELEFTTFDQGTSGAFTCLLAATWGRGIWQACGDLPAGNSPRSLRSLSFYNYAVPLFWSEPEPGQPTWAPPDYYTIEREGGGQPWMWVGTSTGPYFRDASARNDVSYLYRVRAHFPDRDEGMVAARELAQPRYRQPSAFSEVLSVRGVPPRLDGKVEFDEWSDAAWMPMTLDSESATPKKPANAWVKNDATHLYIAVIDENTTALPSTVYRLTASVDWNQDREWTRDAIPESEGSFIGQATADGTATQTGVAYTRAPLRGADGSWPTVTEHQGWLDGTVRYAFGIWNGTAQHEMAVQIPAGLRLNCGSEPGVPSTRRCIGLALLAESGDVVLPELYSHLATGVWPYGAQTTLSLLDLRHAPYVFGDVMLGDQSALPMPGDLNGDGSVTFADARLLLAAFASCAPSSRYLQPADYDGDGCITLRDYQMWYALFLKATP